MKYNYNCYRVSIVTVATKLFKGEHVVDDDEDDDDDPEDDMTQQSSSNTTIAAQSVSPPSTTVTSTASAVIPTKNVGLYIHVPYCRKRCYYCNFAIVPVGDPKRRDRNPNIDTTEPTKMTTNQTTQQNSSSSSLILPTQLPSSVMERNEGFYAMNDQYVRAIIKEIQLIALQHQQLYQPQQPQELLQNHTTTSPPTSLTTATLNPIVLQSIYFGGGTPSLLPLTSLREILYALRDINCTTSNPFAWSDSHCEITMEVDPGTFTYTMVKEWYNLGINRFSLGVQSMDDTLLRHLGRTHTVSDIYGSIQLLHLVYGNHLHYSIDLISGIPGLTLTKWMETLDMVTNTLHPPPKHLSVYDLQIESNTVFGRRYKNHRDAEDNDDDDDTEKSRRYSEETSSYLTGLIPTTIPVSNLPLPSQQDSAFMYQYASGYLRSKSYEHYEISSYAYIPKPSLSSSQSSSTLSVSSAAVSPSSSFPYRSYRSRHNQIYWGYPNVSAWYALGLGATSFDLQKHMVKRPNAMSDYIQWVNNAYAQQLSMAYFNPETAMGSRTKHPFPLPQNPTADPPQSHPTDDPIVEEVMDVVLKRLRTSDGLSLQYIQEQYGKRYVDAILKGLHDVLENNHQQQFITLLLSRDIDNQHQILRLTDPMGFLYSNTIISNIFYELN
jgi:oxygen-independent coproporphyrinogen-3 oxidase